ncbi:hypothetical protein LY90DRAFT_664455 [Neocallimastix californiae]|uniref:G-protein coupled receptors family 3 profile domain-containing protein n=1 Tax=Neocallimastix californiae TaxID=1754190 RepID=A0A1Y2FB71_9FUNG|nr:hypothetical protein LY90DRAFT_664455 [Neocallimastix californiae]|eukprot:ORY80586.1 hypothetical protein LY90DRAFT_664455 [Neocallimastix californiae]
MYTIFKDNFSLKNGGGSFMYINVQLLYDSETSIKNVKYYGAGNVNQQIKTGGLFISVEGNAYVNLKDIYCENLNGGGGVFMLEKNGSLDIKNIEIHNVSGSQKGGLLLTTNNEEVGIFFNLYNGTFTNFYQNFDLQSSTLIWTNNYLNTKLQNLVYSESSTTLELINISIDNYYSKIPTSLFLNNNADYLKNKLKLDFVSINSHQLFESIINYSNAEIIIKNSNFTNINGCLYSDSCNYQKNYKDNINFVIMDMGPKINLIILDSIFDSIYESKGFKATYNTNIFISNSIIKNSSFREGIISINSMDFMSLGQFHINNTVFLNNVGVNGVILNIKDVHPKSNVNFTDCIFKNNYSSNYGGVVYSESEQSYLHVSFDNCTFNNNTAYKGNISYSYIKSGEPKFSNIKELREIHGAFITNPTSIQLTSDSETKISLLSGNTVSNIIKFNLIDDYGNICSINSDETTYNSPEEMIFFKIEISDNYNALVSGQIVSYCLNNTCLVPPVQILGNPGNYLLQLRLNTFGPYKYFNNSVGSVKLTIKNCYMNYLNRDIEGKGFKSCYTPSCKPSCNFGKCINNNKCDCSKTKFTGPYCNEYYKLKRFTAIDIIIKIIGYILALVSVILIFLIILFKQNKTIKSASYEFLIITLIGVIFYSGYCTRLTQERVSKAGCIVEYLSNNLGFSLVYGSILVKTYRIYKM